MRQQSFAASATFAFTLLAAGVIGIGSISAEARVRAQSDVVANSVGGTSAVPAEKKICKRIDLTGSRVSRDRVCLTREDWKKVEEVK